MPLPKAPTASAAKVRVSPGHDFVLDSFSSLPAYRRGGVACYLCHARKKLIKSTPEEVVRQAFIRFLLNEVKVPADCLEAEVPMSDFRKGAAGRADIVIYARQSDVELVPIAIVECKEPSQPIIDQHLRQAERYDAIVDTGLVIITNGCEAIARSRRGGQYHNLVNIPTYQQMVKRTKTTLEAELGVWVYDRIAHKPVSEELIQSYEDDGIIGKDTPAHLHSFLVNLIGLLDDDTQLLPRFSTAEFPVIQDQGLRFTNFGNAAGGSWPGNYRYYLVKHNDDDCIVSISVMGKAKFINDPVFGNSVATTMLCIAVDDYDKSHLSLELALDRFTVQDGESITVWHNGTLTNGKKGAVKPKEVVDFVATHAPDLVDEEGYIILGQLNNKQLLTWKQAASKAFITNLIRYALLRDDFRRYKNSLAKPPAKAKKR
ncbi:type I restriction enzyme HsdR N-terminal domain-containing protein [Hymenobacter sp. BT18]|uniref:type I restriction enzyme HsdR N-terminal domain-containing protein n=1 Tax=Hymenobacter sp. BT18 TaxID=2835648 RepID=UPI00143EC6F4|nr:type I restriction enzyme HsdR N-terminal domain-containing protein [Hymenobacter sp. BT18]QIX62732.1 type I restriction enzyme HsdR N-terminal domain-containing protein [Hymenobacter sp. BT18]